jgi:hypothetical protein
MKVNKKDKKEKKTRNRLNEHGRNSIESAANSTSPKMRDIHK